MESDTVILFGFNSPCHGGEELPNSLHVALTRCSGGNLYILDDYRNELPLFASNMSNDVGDIMCIRYFRPPTPVARPPVKKRVQFVDSIARYTENHHALKYLEILKFTKRPLNLDEPCGDLDDSEKDILDLYKFTSLVMCEHATNPWLLSLYNYVCKKLPKGTSDIFDLIRKKPSKSITDWVQLAVIYSSADQFHHKLHSDYNLDGNTVSSLFANVKRFQFAKYRSSLSRTIGDVKYISYVEAFDSKMCPVVFGHEQYSPMHVVVAAMHATLRNKPFGYFCNIRENYILEVQSNDKILALLCNPVEKGSAISDEGFLQKFGT